MTIRQFAAALTAAVALAAGCSSGSEPADTGTTSSATTTSVSTAPAKVAPVSAFASIVAEFGPRLTQAASATDTACATADTSSVCQDSYATLGDLADQLHVRLMDVHSPMSATYLGAPAPEVEGLVSDTEELASKVSATAAAYTSADCPDVVTSCTQEKVFVQGAATELVQKLTAWAPHI